MVNIEAALSVINNNYDKIDKSIIDSINTLIYFTEQHKSCTTKDIIHWSFQNIFDLETEIYYMLRADFGDMLHSIILDYDDELEVLLINIHGNIPYPLEASKVTRRLLREYGYLSYNTRYIFRDSGDYIAHGNPRYNDNLPYVYNLKYGKVNSRFKESEYDEYRDKNI